MERLRTIGGVPPILPSLTDQIEEYLLKPEDLQIHDPIYSRRWWPRVPDPLSLYTISVGPPSSTLEVERDPATGAITGLREVAIQDAGSTAKNSLSMKRAPGPPEEIVRGSSTNFPFWPGGFPEPSLDQTFLGSSDLNFKNLLNKHPKLSRGMEFAKEEVKEEVKEVEEVKEEPKPSELIVSIADMLQVDENVLKIFDAKEERTKGKAELKLDDDNDAEEGSTLESAVIAEPAPKIEEHVLKISEEAPPRHPKSTEWAEMIDVSAPVDDFHARVPNMAIQYPFELDTFQKQAVLHLQNHDCVFVAAHTSAGKTVVAEYAIALANKHMTRSVYTSPIKALSNQKYHDFRTRFDDVGLLTGDIQINPKAACLIMTTEILQSMLYNGSDLIRDLEWVIFDEVHYINDPDRGHVWEEVIIMLPSHVNIVLLSATVPNTLEFADWIGRIKKQKIYVISTTKRPVPLEHYLYTGMGGKSKNERFLIVDSSGKFVKKGYNDAVAAKKERASKAQQQYGPKHRQNIGEKQEKNMWIGLLDHLTKCELLPIVAFTLSKKRCDSNAAMLLSQDLTTQKEKHEIDSFFKMCVDRLQGTDRELPQILHTRELLRKGIGVHHSGILPLVKEVVEMLFSKGLVKLLFATETFAMGVNMPARCVVFDSPRKHDGKRFRDLLPSEYIQMAGRAGRRGLDPTGTVVILCKGDVPELSELHAMMLGKPTKLESQFKLTYSMILQLLRVEALRVEDMMKRSFSESFQMKNQEKYERELKKVTEEMTNLPSISCMLCKDNEEYYAVTRDYITFRKEFFTTVYLQAGLAKVLSPGRLVLISHNQFQNQLCCIVRVDSKTKGKITVLTLLDERNKVTLTDEEASIRELLAAGKSGLQILEKTSHHDIVEIPAEGLVALVSKTLKVDGEKIIDNVKKRQIPRFRDDPPSSSVMEALKELQRINESGGEGLKYLDLRKDLNIRKLETVDKISLLEQLKGKVLKTSMECPQFAEHFSQTYKKLKLKEDIARLKYLMSEESLHLHPEYQMRLEVLKQLGYIESSGTVTLKGKVACEMGNHELMITELVLENVFDNMPIEETVALLSSMVFQQKNCSEPSLTPELESGIKKFKSVAQKIGEVQRDCGLKEAVGDYVDQYNFGLVEVTYEWALGKPFNEIMSRTDVQEGITVKCIQRLDETLRDVRNAARIIGEPTLYQKMEEASTAIKRDIVFAASLYTQ
ncbi:superkiller complex helicase subunit twister [Oratosquilla oratoria]|uniref:superkiller complex helicase subunit twister n=1 Tax=Oratosquilla oratoria TaxID=337810 RepID=UPI003F765D40